MSCPGPVWSFDDFNACFRHVYLQQVPLTTVLVVSFVLAAYATGPVLVSWAKRDKPSYQPLLQDEQNTQTQSRDYGAIQTTKTLGPSADAALLEQEARDPRNNVTITVVSRSTGDRVRFTIEALTSVAQLGLAVAAATVPSIRSEWQANSSFPLVNVLYWLYASVLVAVRLSSLKSRAIGAAKLWSHSTVLYVAALVSTSISVRSAVLHPFSPLFLHFMVASWTLSLILVVATFSSQSGNRPARLYQTDDLRPSIEPVSSLFALISFSWVNPLIWEAFWRPLDHADVWDLRDTDHAFHVLAKFRRISRRTSFLVRLVKHFRRELTVAAVWAFITSITVFGPAMLVKAILDYVEDPESVPRHVAWTYVASILVFALFDNVANGQALFIGRRICIRMRAIIIGEVYAKALRRKAASTGESKLGQKKEKGEEDDDKKGENSGSGHANHGAIINLMAIDAFKVSEICGYLHYFVSGIFMIIFSISLTCWVLGWSALVGAAALVAMSPLNYLHSRAFGRIQNRLMTVTDERVKKTDELLQSIRIIKYFAWEQKFADGVMQVRKKELDTLFQRYALWSLGALMWFTIPMLITSLSFGCYTLVAGNKLTSPVAFTALTLFNIMRIPMDQIADMLSNVLQSKVSIDRIDEFLNEAETQKHVQLSSARGPNSPEIGFENASFAWISKSETAAELQAQEAAEASGTVSSTPTAKAYNFRLQDLNISFPVGQLSVIVGPTGSGKTSLLMALLGEMELEAGKVYLPTPPSRDVAPVDPRTGLADCVAYCSQQAWLLNDTLKNNILFAADFNQERYDRVLAACALTRDLEILKDGDQTLVGEKGIALSGGQKQRISLARAMYSTARHILLDDCLSAVDSHTALYIYENCLTGEIAQNRTIILVSHNVALTVGQASHMVVMENGRIKAQGTPQELAQTGALGADELVKSNASKSASKAGSKTTSQAVSRSGSGIDLSSAGKKVMAKDLAKKLAETKAGDAKHEQKQTGSPDLAETPLPVEAPQPQDNEEQMARGTVDKRILIDYFKAVNFKFVWGVLIVMIASQQVVSMYQAWWLREWTLNGLSAEPRAVVSLISTFARPSMGALAPYSAVDEAQKEPHSTLYYLTIYVVIGIGAALLPTGKEMIVFWGGLRASKKMFEDLLGAMVRSKVRFFDSVPIGRILNRFSKDMEEIDQDLSPVMSGLLQCVVVTFSIAVLISLITPGFMWAAIVIFGIYYLICVFYLATSRELKRIDAVTRSPIYQHFGETLVGVSTIRAYGDEQRFVRENLRKIDANNRPFFFMWVANRWLSFRVDTAGALVSFGAAAFVMLNLDWIDAGLAGVSLSYALAFNDTMLWVLRLYAMLEMNLNSVERVLEYIKLEPEAPLVIEGSRPPANWPSQGRVQFKDLCLRYAPELPLVIKHATFEIEPFNKIGIVGRTGAGKSTIITALFRFLEADSGSIFIDGVDISTIGLRDLRQALAIIPQDPTLFEGTIRSNLDPFDEYSDEKVFESLRRVHLIETSSPSSSSSEPSENQFNDLNARVSEGGNNLSQGQRQLMCLARSLLKSPKLLLLDEATASIDYETDAKIQKTIREEFGSSTLLTVAHRLRSIIDYDKILVMDAGEIKEYDSPHSLLQRQSIFRDMCADSGELESLEALAKAAS